MAFPSAAGQRWTSCHCCLKREKGECPRDIRFVRQAAVRCVLCVYATVCFGSCHCCSSVFLSACSCPPCVPPSLLFSGQAFAAALPLQCSSAPSFLAPDCHPSPLAEGSLLCLCSQIAEACCAFKESRLLAVTHFWLSARKIAPARLTEKKTNNFSFVCGVTFH